MYYASSPKMVNHKTQKWVKPVFENSTRSENLRKLVKRPNGDSSKHIQADTCCKTLQLLVRFFRCLGFSFSGVLFIETPPADSITKPPQPKTHHHHSSDSVILQNPPAATKTPNSCLRYILLTYNILILLLYLTPFVHDHMPSISSRIFYRIHGHNDTSTSSRPHRFWEHFARIGNEQSYTAEAFTRLKPILRYMISSLVAVFFLDGLLAFGHNLLLGGALLRRIAAVSSSRTDGRSRRRGVVIIVLLLTIIPAIMLVGVVFFNKGGLGGLVEEATGSGENWRSVGVGRLLKLLIHWGHFLYLSMYSVLFGVTMVLFGSRIEEMTKKVEEGPPLRESQLLALQSQLECLNAHFTSILTCFSLPITFTLAASTFTLIGSVCFLMISPDRSYASFIFSMGLFAFLRLVIVSSCGNLATNAYRKLLRAVFESLEDETWTIDVWLAFGEMRKMKSTFKVAFFSETFKVKQSAILTLIGFALNYIVVLLQTESYGGGGDKVEDQVNGTVVG